MYDQFYGLTGRPFQLTPDPQFYFESGTHRKALSYLGYGLAQGEGFIVITGEVGAGKSTLVGHLMQSIDKARLTAATIVTSGLGALDMVHMAAESFGIHSNGLDKAATLTAIESHLHSEARAGRRCLLIVDEAQNLSVEALEELRMLSNFQLGASPLLQVFLLGQPEFRDLLKSAPGLEQLRQRVIATHHLEAMEADEIEPYLVHRLSRVGWTGRPSFTADAIAALFAETQGVPRKLNTLMNRVLLMGAVEQLSVIDGALVEAVVADLAGKPFEYLAPEANDVPEINIVPEVAEIAVEETHEAAAEPLALVEAQAIEDAAPVLVQSNESLVAAMVPSSAPSPAIAEFRQLSDRIAGVEKQLGEQDIALRKMLSMLIDWMEKENAGNAHFFQNSRAA
jgi:putative secretion ATPase (PEP-CTERM system associated)